jgi:hypothetical protein
VAATACVAAGVAPFGLDGGGDDSQRPAHERPAPRTAKPKTEPAAVVNTETLPSQIGHEWTPPPPVPAPDTSDQGTVATEPAPSEPAPEPAPVEPTVATTAPPTEQEFSVSSAAVAPSGAQPAPAASGVAEPSSPSNVRQEFGP